MKPSEQLKIISSKSKIKCARYRFYDRPNDITIDLFVKVNYTDKEFELYTSNIDVVSERETDGWNKQYKHEIWLENGEYMVNGHFLELEFDNTPRRPEPIPDFLKE